MANQYPVEPDWQRPWQQELGTQRHIEKTMISGAANLEESGVTSQQRRRFQRTELIKPLALVLGSLIALFVILTVYGLIFNR